MQLSSSPTRIRRPLVAVALLCALLATGCGDLVEVRPLRPVELQQPSRPTRIVDATGRTLADLDGGRLSRAVPLDRVAPVLVDAVIAIEDRRFRDHDGVDVRAIGRAAIRNARDGRLTEGGSTITQQLAKNTVTGSARTVQRKIAEASVAWQLEQDMTKDEILERYLNSIYFGNGAYGVEAAAREYFATSAADLDLGQAALLAGLLRSPARYDPRRHQTAAKTRRKAVVARMVREGMITARAATAAAGSPVVVSEPTRRSWRAAYFVDHVLDVVTHDPAFAALGGTARDRATRVFAGDLRIETTLDPTWQRSAERAVASTAGRRDDPAAAVVAIAPATGGIRALVGGRDYFADTATARFNLATDARRQPGSTFKSILLAAALADGWSADDAFAAPARLRLAASADGDEQDAPAWTVANADQTDYGTIDLRTATALSVNVVYAQLIAALGADRMVTVAHDLGVRSALRPYRSLALGAQEVTVLDMASVQATLAAGGVYRAPTAVTRIVDADGTVVYQRPEPSGRRVLDRAVASQVTDVLGDVIARGTGKRAQVGRPAAGKTGTTQDGADAWFTGYTPDLAAAIWVGFPHGRVPMKPPRTRALVQGGTWPADIFARLTRAALAQVPANDFTVRVPDVEGHDIATARRNLTAAGFAVQVSEQFSASLPPGVVVDQRPRAGGSVVLPVRHRIDVTVTSGRRAITAVPDLLGLPATDAVDALDAAGLVARVERVCPGTAPTCTGSTELPGRVWEQSPQLGADITAGDAVTVRVFPTVPPPSPLPVGPTAVPSSR